MTTVATLLEDMLHSEIVDVPDVARVLGTTPRSVSRWAAEGSLPRRDNEERLLELKAVVDALRQVMREEAARLWFRSPVPALDYRKPIDLIEQGEYRTVIGAILSIGEGVTP
ncbi:MAG: antitoxin Xre/MbcA/ParS toxin-binding domain-containing protein [Nitriliruptorales bacterium]